MNYIENNGLYYRNHHHGGHHHNGGHHHHGGTIIIIIITITEVDGAGVAAHGAVDFSLEVLLEVC